MHLTGPPGVGKSRLAAALAERSERELLWVTLRGARTLAALRTALGVEAPGEQELQVGLRSLRDCLLVLDDADLALPALERAMGRWLAACPGLQVLLTSQRTGDFPEAHSESLAPLERGAAVELFCARWVEVTGRRPSPEERQLSESLCERLDHLPLALEVAASRGRVLSMKQLHQRLHSHADELLRERGSARSALGVSLDLTWAGLDEPLRHLLMRCAVWPGAFSLQDLDALAPELDQVHLLSEVLVRSLLCKIHGASDEPRFRLYRPVRDYAWLELQTQDPSQLLERRDAYVLAESERAIALLRGPRAVAAEHRLVELSPALEERRRRALDESDVDTALRCTLALHEVMLLRGLRDLEPYREVGSAALNGGCESTRHARFLLAWAVAGARIGQVEEPLRQLDQAVESLASSPHAAEALLARGRFHAQHGAFDQARRDLAEAALRVRETGDTYLLGSIRNVEGCVHEICGVTDAQEVWCWGVNDFDQIGEGQGQAVPEPVKLTGGGPAIAVAAGSFHTCIVEAGGAAQCRGESSYGQTGTGVIGQDPTWQPVVGNQHYANIEVGSHFSCGIVSGQGAYCWGDNGFGQLASGLTGGVEPSFSPTPWPMAAP